jgi:hypothetical protein
MFSNCVERDDDTNDGKYDIIYFTNQCLNQLS